MWPLVISVVSSVLAGWSSYEQGKDQKEQSEQNAKQLEFDRADAEAEDREAMRRQRYRFRTQQKELESHLRKTGVAMEGTPLAILGQNLARQEMSMQDMAKESRARQFRYGQKAKQEIYSGRMAYTSGRYKAGQSLLRGANRIASRYG